MDENWQARKQKLQQDNKAVVRPIPRMDRDILKTRRRKKKYTPTTMRNKINKFFECCENNDEVPSIKGMMIFLGMYREMFYTYAKYPEFTDIMDHARMIIANWAEIDVYNTKGTAAGKIAYMKNIHGWSDKLQTKNETVQVQMTPEQAKAKIEELAPKLLEVLQNQYTVDQIAKPAEDALMVDESP